MEISEKDRITLTYEILSRINYKNELNLENLSLETNFNAIEELLEKNYLKNAFPIHNVRIFYKMFYFVIIYYCRIFVKII